MKAVVAGVTGFVKIAGVNGANAACFPKMIVVSVREAMNREQAWAKVQKELDHQVEKWNRPDGEWPDDIHKKNTVLGEEVGEVANAILEHDYENLEVELAQVAAVCISILMSEFPRVEYVRPNDTVVISPSRNEILGHKGKGYFGD